MQKCVIQLSFRYHYSMIFNLLFIMVPLKHLTLTDSEFADKHFSLIRLIMESPAIWIMFLSQECAWQLWTFFTGIRGFGKIVPLQLSGKLIFCPTMVSDDEWFTIIGFIHLVRVRCSINERPWKFSNFWKNYSYQLKFSKTFRKILCGVYLFPSFLLLLFMRN